ncbi:MAG: hypothetical protein Q7T82_00875 [Armatimonadota bacterium]|nr:hypothetical protein [Armatimonadota bacterium]
MRSRLGFPIVLAALLLWPLNPCLAADADTGGIFVDDFQITNNGITAFFDDFQDRDIRDWRVIDAQVFGMAGRPPVTCMYINQHTKTRASAFHSISLNTTGVVELNAAVWLPPTKDQYKWRTNVICVTDFVLYSGDCQDDVRVGIEMRPKETSYRLFLWWDGYEGPQLIISKIYTESAVLAPERWSLLTLRMDPTAGKMYALLDGKQHLTLAYNPRRFRSLRSAAVLTRFGDHRYELQP